MTKTSVALYKLIGGLLFLIVVGGAIWTGTRTLTGNQNTIEGPSTPFTALAIEGRDLFHSEGCTTCHQGSALGAPLVLAGAAFAPQFPFQNPSVSQRQLREYLLGPNDRLYEPVNEVPSEQVHLNTLLYHVPSYSYLATTTLHGRSTQSKMLAMESVSVLYREEILVTASERIAGVPKIEAIVAFLAETSAASGD